MVRVGWDAADRTTGSLRAMIGRRTRAAVVTLSLTAGLFGATATSATATPDKFCGEIARLKVAADALTGLTGQELAATSSAISKSAKTLKDMAKKAPKAIKTDLNYLSGTFASLDGMLRTLAGTKLADAKKVSGDLTPKITKLMADKRLETSLAKVNNWTIKNCV